MRAQVVFFFYPFLSMEAKEEMQPLFTIDAFPSAHVLGDLAAACGRPSDGGPSAFLVATLFLSHRGWGIM